MPRKKPPPEPIDRDALLAEIDAKLSRAWKDVREVSIELGGLGNRMMLAFELLDEAMTAYSKLKHDMQKSE
jgi:hypothetical protein